MNSGYWACHHGGDGVQTDLGKEEISAAVQSGKGTLWVDIDIRDPEAVALLSGIDN